MIWKRLQPTVRNEQNMSDSNSRIFSSDEDIHLLVAALPTKYHARLHGHPLENLLEVILDLRRLPQARFTDHMTQLPDEE